VTNRKERSEALWQEVLDGIREIKAYNRGELPPGTLRVRRTIPIAPPAEIRARMELSQQEFATILGVSVRTLQEWEQGRRQPTGPARALLRIADQQPEVFSKLRYTELVEGPQGIESAQPAMAEPVT
jgi:putative transcriptional regulator